MSRPLRGDVLLNGIPAVGRVLSGAPVRIIPPAVGGRRRPLRLQQVLAVNHTSKFSRRTTRLSVEGVGTLGKNGRRRGESPGRRCPGPAIRKRAQTANGTRPPRAQKNYHGQALFVRRTPRAKSAAAAGTAAHWIWKTRAKNLAAGFGPAAVSGDSAFGRTGSFPGRLVAFLAAPGRRSAARA